MITAIGVLPHPPLLLREYRGADLAAPDLQQACQQVVRRVGAAARRIVVLCGAPETSSTTRVPLGCRIADELLAETGWTGLTERVVLPFDAEPTECERVGARLFADLAQVREPVGLLVMADGSARRGIKAPGHVDPRAAEFDERFRRGIDEADRAVLKSLEPDVATQLLFQGRAALQALAALPVSPRAEVLYTGDPFGVLYIAAIWMI